MLTCLPVVAQRRLLSRAVALGAQRWARCGRRSASRIRFLPRTPCVPWQSAARGRVRAALGHQLAVRALVVLGRPARRGRWSSPPWRAIGLAGAVQGGPDPGVALHAGDARVARVRQLGLVDVHRRRPAPTFSVGVGVALQAVAVGHALRVEDPPHLVRLVAVHAGRNQVRLLLPQLAADHLAVHVLDPRVALRAGLGDVVLGDGGARVGVRQHEVRGVAARADRRHRQARA